MNIYEVHKSNPKLFRQLTLKDQLFLYYNCPQTDQILKLYLNYNQLAFIISGSRIIHHGDNTWVSNKDFGLLLKRCAFLQELPPDYSGWEVLVMYLKDDYIKRIFEEFRPYLNLDKLPEANKSMIEEISINEQVRNCYESLIPYFIKPQLLPDAIFEGKFKELLFNIIANPSNKHILAYINQMIGGYQIPVWEVMEANYMYNLTLREYSQIANRSQSTFRREFEAHYGMPPGQWLTIKRLARAERLLKNSNKRINEIAFESGFKNVSYFSTAFKNKYDYSPTKYRKLKS